MSDNVERINQVYYTLFSQPFGLKVIQSRKVGKVTTKATKEIRTVEAFNPKLILT